MDDAIANLPPVLAWHKVGTPELGGTWCTVRQFRAQLAALRRSGWTAIDLASFADGLDQANAPAVRRGRFTDRAVLLTFDDAFASFEQHAWPELERVGWPTTLFVVTDFVGRRASWDLPLPGRRVPHLDWPALRDLVRAGVGIGSHGATHRDLRRLDDAALRSELDGSRRVLEDGLGVAVGAVAYPFGRADARVRTAARAAGYSLGFSMWLPGSRGALDRFALRRHGGYRIDGPGAVLDKVDPARALHRIQVVAERAISACAAVATWRA